MPYPFPSRTLSSTLADHVEDHNTIEEILGLPLLDATDTRDAHLAEHNDLHPDFGLPSRALGDSAAFHLNDHAAMHTNLIQTYAGPRGSWGQQLSTGDVPGWPVSFTSSHSSFLSLQSAVNAGGTGRIFRVTSDMTFTASLTPHTNDQFWFDPGVLITGTALTVPAFRDNGANVAGLKFMNGSFTGFRSTLDGRASSGWEIGYCTFTDENANANNQGSIRPGINATPKTFIHHCRFFSTDQPIYCYQVTTGVIIEDCEFDTIVENVEQGFKLAVGNNGIEVRYCWMHGNDAGIWFDFWNFGCILEWCEVNNNTGYGVWWEANPGPYGTAGSPEAGVGPTGAGNITRYNYIHDNGHAGIVNHGSAGMDIYGNYLYRDQSLAQTGVVEAEFQFYVNSHHVGPRGADQASDLRNNNVHNNYIEVTPSIGGHQPKRGAVMRVDTGTFLTSVTPWVSNTKLNNWYDNHYKFNRALTSTDLMGWPLASTTITNKTWAQWQALPQDATSTAEA